MSAAMETHLDHRTPPSDVLERNDVRPYLVAAGRDDQTGLSNFHVVSERVRNAMNKHAPSTIDVEHVVNFKQELHLVCLVNKLRGRPECPQLADSIEKLERRSLGHICSGGQTIPWTANVDPGSI